MNMQGITAYEEITLISAMKDYYSILDIPTSSDQNEIRYAFDKARDNINYSTNDYDNMQFLIEKKHAYRLLSNKAHRFLYDIKANIPREKRCPIHFENDNEVSGFTDVIENKFIALYSQNMELLRRKKAYKQELSSLSKEKEKVISEIHALSNKCLSMSETINNTHATIEKKEILIVEKETNIRCQESHIQSLGNHIQNLESRILHLENQILHLENKNDKLYQFSKRIGIRVFKIIAFISTVFLLILIIILNI